MKFGKIELSVSKWRLYKLNLGLFIADHIQANNNYEAFKLFKYICINKLQLTK